MDEKMVAEANAILSSMSKRADASSQFAEGMGNLVRPLLMTAAFTGAMGGYKYYMSKQEIEKHQKDLDASMGATAARSEKYKVSPDTFFTRFNELSMISPTIAKNPSLAYQAIDKSFDSGFSIDDVHKLTAIENNSRYSGLPNPGAAGRSAALHTLDRIITHFGPAMYTQMSEGARQAQVAAKQIVADNNAAYAANAEAVARQDALLMSDILIAEKHLKRTDLSVEGRLSVEEAIRKATAALSKNRIKKGSANMENELRVSESCMGQMLAERHVLYKTAGLGSIIGAVGAHANQAAKATGSLMAKGGKSLGAYLAMMAPVLAIGGGLGLVQVVMQKRQSRDLDRQADLVFNSVARKSDIIQGDPEAAREAFDSLKSFAPSLAIKPQITQTFVEHVIASQSRLPIATIKEMAETQGKVNQNRKGVDFMAGFKNPITAGFSPKSGKDVFEAQSGSTDPFKWT